MPLQLNQRARIKSVDHTHVPVFFKTIEWIIGYEVTIVGDGEDGFVRIQFDAKDQVGTLFYVPELFFHPDDLEII